MQGPLPPQAPQAAPQPFSHLGGNTPAAGSVQRALNFARAVTGKTVILTVAVIAAQAVLPEGRRPSDLIGSLTGLIHSSELDASRNAQALTAGQTAEAQARAQTQWAIEAETARQQQAAIISSLDAKQNMANAADYACMGGAVIGALFGQNRDVADLASAAKAACGESARLRQEIVRDQAEATRLGSALMQRGPNGVGPAPYAAPQR